MVKNIRKPSKIALLFLIAWVQVTPANMLAPASQHFNYGVINVDVFEESANHSMYLGQWRTQISNKINPSYFNQLVNFSYSNNFEYSASSYSVESYSIKAPVFSEDAFSLNFNETNLYFSFSSENIIATPFAVNQFLSTFDPNSLLSKSNANPQLVQQEYYAPGYIFSHGKSSFGLAAVLVQQRFLDSSYGSVVFASSSTYALSDDKALLNTNRGTGYQLSFTQKLPASIHVSIDYHSEIEMNEFDSLGQSYSDPGDFDIPSQYTVTLAMPFLNSNSINFSAEKISYSDTKTNVHSGYSDDFLNTFNSPISPIFRLEDLTVYTISYGKILNETTSVNFNVISRQQAPASARIYNNILENDTAAVSYKIGMTHKVTVGEFNFFASFANKPLLIGSTDFGRFSNNTLSSHVEGVASWSLRF